MKYSVSSKDSGNFTHSDNPGRVIRRHLLSKRQAVHRGRKDRNDKLTGFVGGVLAILSISLAVLLMVIGFTTGHILNDLPDIDQLPAMANRGGSLYSPTLMYDRTGQHLIAADQSKKAEQEYIFSKTRQWQSESCVASHLCPSPVGTKGIR